MFTQFKVLGLAWFVASLGLIGGASTSVGQTNSEETIDAEYFQRNMLYFMAACDGKPEFTALSDESPRFYIYDYVTATVRHRKATWISPNCAVLISNVRDVSIDVVPGNRRFNGMVESPDYLGVISNKLMRAGEPSSLADTIANRNPLDVYYSLNFYSDTDQSGSFEPSERLQTDSLKASQVQWLYDEKFIYHQEFAMPFVQLDNYAHDGSVYFHAANFVGGPLADRSLFFVAMQLELE